VAELRSFIIGVTIAGAVLLIGGLAFGLFGEDSSGSPSVRLLGTPPATRTPPPAATRDPSQLTPVPPTPTSQVPASGSPGAATTPSTIQTATSTLEVAPTLEPTETPPPVDPVVEYVDTANQYTPALLAQIEYLISNAAAPNVAAPDWRSFTLESAQNLQSLAGALAGLSAPACVSAAHGSLIAAANQASSAAGQVIAAVNANDAAAVSAAGGALAAARDLVGSAVTEVSNTIASSC
jgi:hypothetical protein